MVVRSVIAIRGLDGHYERSWTHDDTKTFWLRDLLPLREPAWTKCSCLVFHLFMQIPCSSDSWAWWNPLERGPTFDRGECSHHLRGRCSLTFIKDSQLPLIFLAHSMGGLVLISVGFLHDIVSIKRMIDWVTRLWYQLRCKPAPR